MDEPAAPCRYKDLCIDVVDLEIMTPFWSQSLGLRVAERRQHTVRLDGETDEHRVWLNAVPEPKTVKHRVHVDLWAPAIDELLALGARRLDSRHPRWDVLADPEGGELCAFVAAPGRLPAYRLKELAVDAADPATSAAWWAERFRTTWQHHRAADDDYCWIEPAAGLPWRITFAEVPEPKTVKNRLHLDVHGSTPDLLGAGARMLRPADSEHHWDVLGDPEGNEFCVFGD